VPSNKPAPDATTRSGDIPPFEEAVSDVRLRRLRLSLFVVYGTVFVWSFANNGLPVARLAVLGWVAVAFIIGSITKPTRQQLQMVADLTLYAIMWLSYDYSRGIADSIGFPLQVEMPRNVDRFLFFGTDPNTWMQKQFLEDSIRWYDTLGSLVYFTHFLFPVAMSVYFWTRDRAQWLRYIRRFATVLFAGVATYVLLPTAPPWMASSERYPYQILEPLERTTGRGWSALGLDTVNGVILRGQQWANPTAAIPSLHAAFALFMVVFIWSRVNHTWIRALLATFPIAMALSLVYFAEHYVIDVLAGWLYVAAAFWYWGRREKKKGTKGVNLDETSDIESVTGLAL
jgi:membrane-associated phospholipid phosphatase